jgi:hypothetical protein
MNEKLKQLLADLAVKQGEAKNLLAKSGVTTAEINAKAEEINSIQAKIELQKQSEGGQTLSGLTDEATDANVAAFKNAYPNLFNSISNSAKAEERQRLQNIDAIGGQVGAELLNKAKYTEPMTAKDLAFEAMKVQQQKGAQFLQNFAAGTAASGVNGVGAAPGDLSGAGATDEQQRASLGDKIAQAANKKMGR